MKPRRARACKSLPFGAVLVTANGHLYSQHGLVLHGPQSELHGVLQRQREIEALKTELPGKIEARHTLEAQQKESEARLTETQDTLRNLRGQHPGNQEPRTRLANGSAEAFAGGVAGGVSPYRDS